MGQGSIRSVESLSLSILRLIQDEALKENTGRVVVHVPIDVATYLLNEKRLQLGELEQQFGIEVLLIPNINLETPHFRLERIRKADLPEQPDSVVKLIEEQEVSVPSEHEMQVRAKPEKAVVQPLAPPAPCAPVVKERELKSEVAAQVVERQAGAPLKPVVQQVGGLIKRVFSALFSKEEVIEEPSAATKKEDREKRGEADKRRSKPRGVATKEAEPARKEDREERTTSEGRRGSRRRGGRSRSKSGKAPEQPMQQAATEKVPAAERAAGTEHTERPARDQEPPRTDAWVSPVKALPEREQQLVAQQLAAPVVEAGELPLDIGSKRNPVESLAPNAAIRIEPSDRVVGPETVNTPLAASMSLTPDDMVEVKSKSAKVAEQPIRVEKVAGLQPHQADQPATPATRASSGLLLMHRPRKLGAAKRRVRKTVPYFQTLTGQRTKKPSRRTALGKKRLARGALRRGLKPRR